MHRSPATWFAFLGFALFALFGLWQFGVFQSRSIEDFYQPTGYIDKVNRLIQDGKLYYEQQRDSRGFQPVIRIARLEPEDQAFYEGSWLKEDIEAFNDGNSEVFLLRKDDCAG